MAQQLVFQTIADSARESLSESFKRRFHQQSSRRVATTFHDDQAMNAFFHTDLEDKIQELIY